ncbi:tetratricopeptide repeat protein [bacterium]|nr:tetratricopeptide repeat protein [bacterium]
MSPTADQKMEEGHMALAMGEMKDAAACYRCAAEIDPGNAEAWQALGMSLVKLDCLEEAISALKKLVSLRPRDQLAYTSLSLAYGRAGKIQEAEEMSAKAKVAAWGGDPEKLAKG